MNIRYRSAAGVWAAVALLAVAPPAVSQELTVQRIFGSREFAAGGFYPQWSSDGESFVVVEPGGQNATDVWSVGISTGKRDRRIQGTALVPAGRTAPIQVEELAWSADARRALIYTNSQQVWRQRTKGTYYVFDQQTGKLTPVSTGEGWQQFAKFSPDGTRVGFVRNNDLFVVDVATGRETQLTHDGSETIINGTFDWVYEEELDLRDGWRWSPDGKSIAFWRLDTSPEPIFTWVDYLSGVYTKPVGLRYPKPGEPNAKVQIGVIDLASGRTRWMDTGAGPDDYLARMDWAASSTELVVQRLNRHQDRLDVALTDVGTGRSRVIFSDTDPAWVNVDDDLTFLNGGQQVLWTSQRDGYNQIYLYGRDGKLVRKLTPQSWDVTGIEGVDEQGGWVYYTGTGGSPMERHLFRVRLDGSGFQKLTREPGTHTVSVSPNGKRYVDIHSRAGVPPVSRLYSADGGLIRVLSENTQVASKLAAARLRTPEFITVPASDGTRLNAWVIRPPNFDASRRYPVLLYEYGTPGSQTVVDAWGGSTYMWHQLLAQKGYIVASVEARGSSGNGRAWEKAGYLRQGEVVHKDLTDAVRYLGTLPYVDASRIGMWGWSGGGYTTAYNLTRGGSLFRAGISVAPVTDWRLYDNLYTERFMRTPQENAEGYRRSSAITYTDSLTARYLLVHGTSDDNVHFQNSVQLANALERSGKQFQFMLYPGRNHSISGGNTSMHLFTMMTDWIEKNL